MSRNILLVEPAYKTKFPPLGLMKISAYHKLLEDTVYFFKGISREVDDFAYWDRIYVSTLFTYHWNVTVETIKHYKKLVKGDTSRIFVGGIMATLMADELWRETGVVPLTGVLATPGALGDDNELVVEDMIPDYELFDKSQFNKDSLLFDKSVLFGKPVQQNPEKYSLIDDSYFGYSTRGCVNKCEFCGVRILEPKFMHYKDIKPYVEAIKDQYGEKEHLVLFDNNVLASKNFKQITHDILDLGFEKGAKVAYKNKAGHPTFKQRHVDFNQGTDLRYINKTRIKLLSKIALHPLRIAFDHISLKDEYCEKVKLAAEHGIEQLSNYILYNWKDTPQDLWTRLNINIDLNKKLGLKIYSFPMKFIPLKAKDRTYVDVHRWNWYFIRNVQRILNVLKGSVMTGREFFYRAFGNNKTEFRMILHMPERILMYRGREPGPEEIDWVNKFKSLTKGEQRGLLAILCENRAASSLRTAVSENKNRKLRNILDYYLPEKN